jgi:hypothetical protein
MNIKRIIYPTIALLVSITLTSGCVTMSEAKRKELGYPPRGEPTFFTTTEFYRSPGLGLMLSIGTTTMLFGGGMALALGNGDDKARDFGLTMMVAGGILGPSAGHMYAGDWWPNGFYFLLAKATIIPALAIVAVLQDGNACHAVTHCDPPYTPMWIAVGAVTAGLFAWEIYDGWDSINEFNEKHKEQRLIFSPLILPPPAEHSNENPAFGLALSGRF